MSQARRAVFLDRDGVLNRCIVRHGKPYPPSDVRGLEILPDVPAALERLVEAGFLLIVVTNQPDVGRGTQQRETVEAMHDLLRTRLPLAEIFVCYEADDACPRKKPNPGMLLEAADRFSIDLHGSFLVGDRWKDVVAGQRAGCRTVFLDYAYAEPAPDPAADFTTTTFAAATDWILQENLPAEESIMKPLADLNVAVFADGADREEMLRLYRNPNIKGFTTNPTLMRKAGIRDYEAFALDILQAIPDRPISFEVFSDDFDEMEAQAHKIASWGPNVFVKIPISNTEGRSSIPLIERLAGAGVQVNVTALMTLAQVRQSAVALADGPRACVSVFAGRIADTGRDPVPLMTGAVEILRPHPGIQLIWASPRELLNVFQADEIGCHIITVTNDILKKFGLVGKDLDDYSLETVQMFRNDAVAAGFQLSVDALAVTQTPGDAG